jgi:hypothetical protein
MEQDSVVQARISSIRKALTKLDLSQHISLMVSVCKSAYMCGKESARGREREREWERDKERE